MPILFNGNDIVFDCRGNIVFCEDNADTRLCCYSCGGKTYNVLVPCDTEDITATVAGVVDGQNNPPGNDCDCANVDGVYTLAPDFTGCPDDVVYPRAGGGHWQVTKLLNVPCVVGADYTQAIVDLHLEVCCDADDIILGLFLRYDLDNAVLSELWHMGIELDRQPLAAVDDCFFFDFNAELQGAGLTINSGDVIEDANADLEDDCNTNFFYRGDDTGKNPCIDDCSCDFSGGSVTLTI